MKTIFSPPFFAFVLMAGVSGCTWVSLTPGGEQIRLLTPQDVGHCKGVGKVTATTSAVVVGFIARRNRNVQEEVNRIARNNAADLKGDTIVPTGPMIDGEQTFNVYRCITP